MTHEIRMVQPSDLVVHAHLNRSLDLPHVYALTQHMGREGFREDRPIEVGEFLDIPGLHLISGHHRVAAAFFSRWDELGGTVFPPSNEGSLRTEYFHDSSEQGWSLPAGLPFAEIPATVVPLAEMDELCLKIGAAHRLHDARTNSDLAKPLSDLDLYALIRRVLKFPDIFRKSNRALSRFYNISPHVIARERRRVVGAVEYLVEQGDFTVERLAQGEFTPERLEAVNALIQSGERTVTRTRDGKTQEYVQKPAETPAETPEPSVEQASVTLSSSFDAPPVPETASDAAVDVDDAPEEEAVPAVDLSPTAEESMVTVKRIAFDPETDQEYEIELPSHEAVQAALLELDYPARGISSMDAANRLAEHFSLTDRQRNARGSANSRHGLFPYWVNREANNLVKSGQLVKLRRGWFAKPEQIRGGSESETVPPISADAASDNPVEDNLSPTAEQSIEENYQQIQGELAADLLQRIKDNSPDFFEELVIDLLVAMGYGGSREEAGRAVGGSGDGGIDGVINEDILGLDVIYVQAKRWQVDVGEPPVRDFVGALQGRRARKGIFITTSAFSNRAKEYVTAIDSRDTKIILIDGHQLAQFMIDRNVGVSVVKSYEIKRVDSDYFAEEGE